MKLKAFSLQKILFKIFEKSYKAHWDIDKPNSLTSLCGLSCNFSPMFYRVNDKDSLLYLWCQQWAWAQWLSILLSFFLPDSAIFSWLNVGCTLPSSGSYLSVWLCMSSIINSGSWIFPAWQNILRYILSKIHENDIRVLLSGQIDLQNIANSIREKQTPKPLLSGKKNPGWKFCSKMLNLCLS